VHAGGLRSFETCQHREQEYGCRPDSRKPIGRASRLKRSAPPGRIGHLQCPSFWTLSSNSWRQVASGDPDPLHQIILDPKADEFVRSRMCEALAMATFDNDAQHADAARFLRACYSQLLPQAECFVWNGWQSAIALLGLTELKPLVEQAFAHGLLSPSWLSFAHFEHDLEFSIQNPAALPHRSHGEFSLFGDTIEELSNWYCFSSKAQRDAERELTRMGQPGLPRPAINPFRKVGRNDLCPCGSGRKFKKCCLLNEFGASALQGT
jgi:Protein of unknown function (DUF1186)/SEC-C motif